MSRGKMVVLEGGDAVGKATQTKILAEAIGAQLFSFPNYNSTTGKAILGNLHGDWGVAGCDDWSAGRGIMFEDCRETNALVLQSLMAANRYEVAGEIDDLLGMGRHVVCDRFWMSGLVYGMADGLDRDWLLRVHESLPQPDLWILLDADPKVSIERRPERRDRYERDDKAEFRRQLYLEEFRKNDRDVVPWTPWRIVDAVGTVDEVSARIQQIVEAHLGRDLFLKRGQ
jgi:dTMP kinase